MVDANPPDQARRGQEAADRRGRETRVGTDPPDPETLMKRVYAGGRGKHGETSSF